MLYIVLVLVLAALGLLVTALITANSLWAWVSIGLSVLAGLILIADWLRRRRRPEPAAEPAKHEAPASSGESLFTEAKASEEAKQTDLLPAAGKLAGPPEPDAETTVVEPVVEPDPGEERTTPEDAELVSGLDVEVVVVDEYPRYHVTKCAWLGGRVTIPINVGEARELGFTPCSRCQPDATLIAAHHDAGSKADS
ncbi:MAG TPA: hypothetical protein VJX66_24655 [Amycolatopsis sp.]|nr:hypothetical protein [Amycolatopsis sp.]